MAAYTDAENRTGFATGALLLAGIVSAAFAEAIAGTVLSLGRGDIIGDAHATPDEFAWLDISYTTLKFMGFVLAAWLMARIEPVRLLIIASLAIGAACALTAMTTRLDALMTLRAVQGFAGGILLVGGQAIIFLVYPRSSQPMLQAIFAIGAVVAPATIAPALEGWFLDSWSWSWIFFSVAPVSVLAAGLLLIADAPAVPKPSAQPFDWVACTLIAAALFCLSYVLSQGSRWNWFEEPRIIWSSIAGTGSFLLLLGWRLLTGTQSIPDASAFGSTDYTFAFIVSFVAGAALFGSAFLIPSFAVSVLGFTPSAAGLLLLPSSALFIFSLLVAALLIQIHGLPPIAMAPLGILMVMTATWMLSGSTSESGAGDMMPAILVRGFGLGFLFLAITLIAFLNLPRGSLASGIGIFNIGRQTGGLIGVAGLQTLIDHQAAANFSVLSAHVTAGTSAAMGRMSATSALLTSKGVDPASIEMATTRLLDRAVTHEATVIAFDTAFRSLSLMFIVVAPVVVFIKIFLNRRSRTRERAMQET